jgi:hypothetical protein
MLRSIRMTGRQTIRLLTRAALNRKLCRRCFRGALAAAAPAFIENRNLGLLSPGGSLPSRFDPRGKMTNNQSQITNDQCFEAGAMNLQTLGIKMSKLPKRICHLLFVNG